MDKCCIAELDPGSAEIVVVSIGRADGKDKAGTG